jgi:hypothetical protein
MHWYFITTFKKGIFYLLLCSFPFWFFIVGISKHDRKRPLFRQSFNFASCGVLLGGFLLFFYLFPWPLRGPLSILKNEKGREGKFESEIRCWGMPITKNCCSFLRGLQRGFFFARFFLSRRPWGPGSFYAKLTNADALCLPTLFFFSSRIISLYRWLLEQHFLLIFPSILLKQPSFSDRNSRFFFGKGPNVCIGSVG